MEYRGTAMSDALSVNSIFTVLRPDLCANYPGRGEAHPFPEIIYLTRGKHYLCIDGTEYSFCEGQMIIYAPNSFHSAASRRPEHAEAAILTFDASSEILPRLYNRVITLNARQRKMLEDIVDEGVGYFCGREAEDNIGGMILREGVDPSRLWGLKKQIEFFLIDVYKSDSDMETKSAKTTRWDAEFADAIAFLQAHLTQSLSLSEIAVGCSMSVSKLKLLFREKVGTGPIDYLIRMRIEAAQKLIRAGKLNFSQIAETLGFTSLHYFSRQFKKVTGMSPSEYAHSI